MVNTSQDFVNRIDLTALTSVTGSEMNQLIASAKPADDKGLIIVTQDSALDVPTVPNPTVSPDGIVDVAHWINYRWTRIPFDSTGTVYHYTWNPTLAVSDAVYLKWQLEEAKAIQALNTAALAETDANEALIEAGNAFTTAQNAQNTANGLQGQINTLNTSVTQLVSQTNVNSGDIATLKTEVDALQNPDTLAINKGGTGATTIQGALSGFGIRYAPRNTFNLYEQFNTGVDAGGLVAGIFTTRPLNTLVNALTPLLDGYITLNNDFTFDLVPGLWIIHGTFPGNACGLHKAQLFDVTNNGPKLIGSSGYTDPANPSISLSTVRGSILLSALTKFKIQHMSSLTKAGNGMGPACNFAGQVEVYGSLSLTYCGT